MLLSQNNFKQAFIQKYKKEIDKPPNMIEYQFLYFFYSVSFNNNIGENQGNDVVTKMKLVNCKELFILQEGMKKKINFHYL